MNELDSEKIAGNLQHGGMEPAGDAAAADVIILNTCSVREKAVQKVYARLGEIKKIKDERQDLVVGVVGCMAQLEGERVLKKVPFVNLLAGPQKGHVMGDLVDRAQATRRPAIDLRMDDDPEPLENAYVLRESRWRAGVTISEGCNRRCSFCVVPFTRGRQRNRVSANIIREVEKLVTEGYIEIVLLGQTVNAYRDPSPARLTFAGLLRRLSGIEGLARIRFTSPHPNEFSDDLIDAIVTCPRICSQVHLPVQSGSTKILRAMRRGYTRGKYLETVARIRRAPRSIAISTDIIVGFPGETEGDFRHTLRLLDEVQYDCVFSFKYSPRPNTAALELHDDVPDAEKRARLKTLQEQQKLIQYNKNAAYLGQIVDVLVDGSARSTFKLTGRLSNNKIVNFDGPNSLMGRMAKVEISGFGAHSLKGVWVQ
ncbi:MAG: tRNA (N6-isopentenyl adenosine(37)-C2)-methylthiotransferase MiaB [Acidobacteriia bacterium]|nr:tRNA (N6-isopentenyl adenosine(37)-C2)-methylthiotransferase MiaB [Terriglobia bacterium]